ncbi:MAG: ribosomal L7Ae/L30e/S12e/Gadd45 family protein [Peptococcales bacterium]
MVVDELKDIPKVVGVKQTVKALQKNLVAVLYIAKDAESRITEPVETQAKAKGIEIIKVPSMKELGKTFGIEVGAAVAAVLIQK